MNKSINLYYIVIFVLHFLFVPMKYEQINSNYLMFLSIITITNISIHLIYMKSKDNNWFRLDVLFLISLIISFYLVPILFYFNGFLPSFYYYGGLIYKYANYGIWLLNLAILSWLIGYHSFFNIIINTRETKIKVSGNYKSFLSLSAISFSIFMLFGAKFILSGEYSAEAGMPTLAKYSYSIFSISIILTTFFLIYNNTEIIKKSPIKLFFISLPYTLLVVVYLFIFVIISSDRGSALQLISALLFTYSILIRSISLKTLLAVIFIGGIILSIIGLGRNTGDVINKGLENLSSQISKNNIPQIYTLSKDLSSTYRIYYKSIQYIENKDELLYGKSMIAPLLGVIPFSNTLFFTLYEVSDQEKVEFGTSSFMTNLVLGKYNKWGEGSNLIADIYINYGSFGVIFIFYILGIVFKKLHLEILKKQNIYFMISAIMIATLVIYWPRSSLFIILKPIVWSIVIYIIFSKLKWSR